MMKKDEKKMKRSKFPSYERLCYTESRCHFSKEKLDNNHRVNNVFLMKGSAGRRYSARDRIEDYVKDG